MSDQTELLLGMDIGTSACKCCLFTIDGVLVASASAGYGIARPHPGWAEQDPLDWWQAVCQSMQSLMATTQVRPNQIRAVGLTAQIGNQVLLDANYRVLRPAPIWQDLRATQESEEISQQLSRAQLAEWLGMDLPSSPTWAPSRLLWLRRHEPQFSKVKQIAQARDWIGWKLTGQLRTDPSSARGIVHIGTGRPADELFAYLDIDPALIPPTLPPDSVLGTITSQAATATGLPTGTPVILGINDLNASVIGMGLATANQGFDITGTSEHVGVMVDRPPALPTNTPLVYGPYASDLRLLYGVTASGGSVLPWLSNLFSRDTAQLLALAETTAPGSGGLLFLPYLRGERAPVWDPHARGLLMGLSDQHSAAHVIRSALEGVAFGLRQILELTETSTHSLPLSIRIAGGAARSRLWNQIKADILGRPLEVLAVKDAACLGAAALAATGLGWYPDFRTAGAAMAQVDEVIMPEATTQGIYQECYSLFTSLYPTVLEMYPGLAVLREGR